MYLQMTVIRHTKGLGWRTGGGGSITSFLVMLCVYGYMLTAI